MKQGWTDLLFASEPLVTESRGTGGSAGQYHPPPHSDLLGLWLHCDLDQRCHCNYHTETHTHTKVREQMYFYLDVFRSMFYQLLNKLSHH